MARQVAERRKNHRVENDTTLPSMELMGQGFDATLKNISASGLACACFSRIPEMTVVGMTIQLPALPNEEVDYYSLTCKGAVVRCEPVTRSNSRRKWLIAIYFTELDPENRQILDRYLQRRS